MVEDSPQLTTTTPATNLAAADDSHPLDSVEEPHVEEEEEEEVVAGERHEEEDADDKETAVLLEVFGPAYARSLQFWKGLLFSTVPLGLIMGLVALAFFNFYVALSDATWKTTKYKEALAYTPIDGGDESVIDVFRLGQGEWWYVGLLAGAGLAVGLTKVLWTLILPAHAFPQKIPSFLEDVRELKSDDVLLFVPILTCSALSIGLGASCGPEAALGASGACIGQIVGQRWRIGRYQAKSRNTNSSQETPADEENEADSLISRILPDFSQESAVCVLDGMAGAFGALFPTQYLSPMLIMELGGHWGPGGRFSATETLARTGLSASLGYAIFIALEDDTLLQQTVLPMSAYDVLPTVRPIQLLEGAVLGVICGFVGLFGLVLLAFGKALGNWTFSKLDNVQATLGMPRERFSLAMLLTPVVGGTLVGLLCVAAPLIFSDGSDQISAVIALGEPLGADVIAVTGILKLVAVSLTLGFGFVGGQIFPFVLTGVCVGTVANLVYDKVPILVAVPACTVAVACAFIPAPFTFTTLSSMMFVLGGAATTPVFVAVIFSYSTVVGCGVIQELIASGQAKKKKRKEANESIINSKQHDGDRG